MQRINSGVVLMQVSPIRTRRSGLMCAGKALASSLAEDSMSFLRSLAGSVFATAFATVSVVPIYSSLFLISVTRKTRIFAGLTS